MRARGFSIVELLVAATLGLILIAALLHLVARGRSTYADNDAIARLQENARLAFSVIEPEIQLAGSLGYTRLPETLRYVTGGADSIVHAAGIELAQPASADDIGPALPGLPEGANDCGHGFAFDLSRPIEGADARFGVGVGPLTRCAPTNGAVPGADTLTIRRAGTESSEPEPGRLQLLVSRLSSQRSTLLFADGLAPAPIDDDREVRDIETRVFYVSRNAVGRAASLAPLPSLRVKSLGAQARFTDTEVLPGVEDLQVQFGIDPSDDLERSGGAALYVDPGSPWLARAQVVAVRLWVRLRGERADHAWRDTHRYRYANIDFTPVGEAQHYPRLLVSRTIALRNAPSR